jgi:hypothetical protein
MAGTCTEERAALRRLQEAYLRKREELNAVRAHLPAAFPDAGQCVPATENAVAEQMQDTLRLSRELRQIQDEVLKAKVTLDECLGGQDLPN